jgi:hypothetical protein
MTTLHQPRAPHAVRHPHHAGLYALASTTDLTKVSVDGTVLDLAAIERALNGIPVNLTAEEQYEAARQLDARGYQPAEITQRTGMNIRRVARWKAAGWPENRPDPTRGLRRTAPATHDRSSN